MLVLQHGELETTAVEMLPEGYGEVSRGHSRSVDRTEGLNMNHGVEASNFDGDRRCRLLC